jgi:hypothetical protein
VPQGGKSAGLNPSPYYYYYYYVQRDPAARSLNHFWRGSAISITDSEYVSAALVIRYAKRIRHITLISVACPALQYFPTLSHKWQNLSKSNY